MLRLRSAGLLAAFVLPVVAALATAHAQAPAVATGDTRTVTEPSFPATCQALAAAFHDVNEDVPSSVETTSTNLDQVRIQSALTACTGTNQAVELTMGASGNNAFLSGPLSIPTGVTLLVDPGVTLYFSRNAQDYDTTQGTHTCGTVSGASNTASCQNLITIKNANNSGIMGFGKLNGRGGDVVLNSFPTSGYETSTTGLSWWDLANDANIDGGSQQNPRGIQVSSSNNVTMYKITFKNPPNFHYALSTVNGFTAWDIKIITPYSARNTDGIDPGNATNVTVHNSWISDGDDNIAVGAPSTLSSNISITNNHFYAGHGESIGSYTSGGVSNVLYDSNAMYGDADLDGGNSTGIRIKSANDRGGLVTNIQYSNSCFANHGTQVQFTPIYNTNTGTLTPNFKNILLQNLRFSNQGPIATGSFTFLGASNNGTVNPLQVTLDNVTVDTIAASNLVAPSNAQITLGPGQVSTALVSLLQGFNGSNGNIITDNRTAPALVPPACTFTFLAPELTGPQGKAQTVRAGQYPTAVVVLAPTFSNVAYPYPTGTVTLTDEASRTFTASMPGTSDTAFIPITNAPAGTHTYTASYAGNGTYAAISSFGSFSVTVNSASLAATTLSLSGVPATTTYASTFTASAALAGGASPTGSINFLVNGSVYATVPLASNIAAYTFNLPLGSYSVGAVYVGDSANAGATAAAKAVSVTGAATATSLRTSATATSVGVPVSLTATVTSGAGTPTGTVSFSYTSTTNNTPTTLGTATLSGGVASFSAQLPQGTDSLVATYAAAGNFAGSASTNSITITVAAAPVVPASTAPIAMPYTMSTVVGGGNSTANTTCTGHADTFGDGCLATQIQITGTGTAADLRGVTADPFGNLYFTDANAALVRKVASNGIVNNFAGYVTGTACVPTATVGCTPTLVKLTGKPRGVASDALGNIFVAGYGDNKVQYVKVTDGRMYLLAGTGTAPTNTTDAAGDGGPAASALLKGPRGTATDASGNIYIADSGDNRIREVLNPTSGLAGAGNIQTVAGTGATSSTGDGTLATTATLSNPQGVAVDSNANIYIAESSKVRAVCVSCSQGSGLYALLNKLGVASPVNGDIYTVAGTSSSSNTTLAPGLGTAVSMAPQKVTLDADGNLYIVDSANNVVWFEDGRTGYTRVLAGGGTATSCPASAIGDGCVATQGIIGSNGGNGIGVGLDVQGNLYISDSTNLRIRKVSNNLRFANDAVATPVSQTVQMHFQPGDTPNTPTAGASSDFSIAAGTCTPNPTDTTTDCTYPVTFKPVVPGLRTTPLAIGTSLGNPGSFGLSGTGLGAAATLDPATQMAFARSLAPNAIAIDSAGYVYVADANSHSVIKYAPGSSGIGAGAAAVGVTLQTFQNPAALALDSLGNLYVADASTGFITQISSSGGSKTLGTVFTAPDGLAVDSLNNVYVADSSAKTVTQIGANLSSTRVLASAGLTSPAGLAVDTNANVFVADPGAAAVVRIDAQTLARTTATNAAASPKAVAVDAAGNLLVADSSSNQILAIPASANSAAFTIASGIPAKALALDSAGNLYTASSASQVAILRRTQAQATYTGTTSAAVGISLLSTGNAAATLTLFDPDTTNFTLAHTVSADCSGTQSAFSVAVGGVCAFNSTFTPTSASNFNNTAVFSGNVSNVTLATPADLEIVQMGNNGPAATTLTFGAFTPANPQVGQTITLNATVASAAGTPTGTVTFAVDGSALAPATVINGAASIPVTGLTAGTHIVTATFISSTTTYAGSTATPAALIVQQLPTGPQNIWLVNGNQTVSKLTNSGSPVSTSAGYLGGGSGIAVDSLGDVWSGTSSGSSIVEFSKSGSILGTYPGGGIAAPVGIAISGVSSVWVANGNNTLSLFNNNGTAVSPSTGLTGGGLNTPSGIAIDGSGNIWVTNAGDSSLTEFIGATPPVVTPLATAAQTSTQGKQP